MNCCPETHATELLTVGNLPNSAPQAQVRPECILETGRDVTAHKRAEEALLRKDALFEAVALAMQALLFEPCINEAMQQALAAVGNATQQDRVYLFEYHVDPLTAERFMSQRYEWVRNGVSMQIDNPDLQNLSFDGLFPRWFDALSQGRAVSGSVASFPETERAILEPQQIVSLMIVPVNVEGHFWGFIGFDNCYASSTTFSIFPRSKRANWRWKWHRSVWRMW